MKCLKCGKEITDAKTTRKKFCNNNCRARYNALKKYYSVKDSPSYQKGREAYYKKWYELNKDKQKDKMKDYYEEHKEELKKYSKEFRKQNLDKIKETKKKYYQKNREKIIKANTEYQKQNKDRYNELKYKWNKTPNGAKYLKSRGHIIKRVCPDCKSTDIRENKMRTENPFCCNNCGKYFGEEQNENKTTEN